MPSRRRSLALLMGATALLGLGVGADARAQNSPAGPTGEELFGAYTLEARGQGMRIRYELEGMLPGGSPVLDLGMPESLTRFTSGPIGYGVASLAYPGGAIVNLPSLAEQATGGQATAPPYPIKQEVFYPTGPTEAVDEQPGGTAQRVTSGPLGVDSQASFPATVAPPILNVGSVKTAARSVIEDGKALSRTRVIVNDVVLLGGVISIDSVVTDLVAAHDGTAGAASGGTVANGVKFLGLDASLTGDGLVLTEAPPVAGPGEPLGGVLTPVVPSAGEALSPFQKALNEVLGQADPQLDDLLSQAGITVSIVEPATVEGEDESAASLNSSGVLVGFDYYGRDQQALSDLLDAIPSELKPNLGPLSNPITFFTENHFTAIGLAPASVTALASPPFPEVDVPSVDLGPLDPGVTVPGSSSLGDPGFSTPTPDTSGGAGEIDGEQASATALGGAIPALLFVAALLASPLFGLGSTRLADNVLAPVTNSCPTGQDKPPPVRPT